MTKTKKKKKVTPKPINDFLGDLPEPIRTQPQATTQYAQPGTAYTSYSDTSIPDSPTTSTLNKQQLRYFPLKFTQFITALVINVGDLYISDIVVMGQGTSNTGIWYIEDTATAAVLLWGYVSDTTPNIIKLNTPIHFPNSITIRVPGLLLAGEIYMELVGWTE
jgi:hypothetical protein